MYPELQPEVATISTSCGNYTADVEKYPAYAGKTIPVAVAFGDNQASFLGSVNQDCKVLLNVGTGGQVSVYSEELIKADSLFKELSFQVPNSYVSYFWRARVNSMLDPETTKGLAKPYYEKVIEIGLVQPERYIRELIECYKYLGYYHYVIADAITTKNNGNPDLAKEEYGEAKSFFSKVFTLDAKDEVALKALESIKL